MTGKRAKRRLARPAPPAPGCANEGLAKPLAKHGYDGNPPRFLAVRDLEGKGKREKQGIQNVNVDRLEWLLARGLIALHQHQAGRRLQRQNELAQIGGFAALDGVAGEGVRICASGVNRLPDTKCDAIAAINAAQAYVGTAAWRILDLVVLEGSSLAKAEARLSLRAGSSIGALTVALDALARHFRLA